MIDEAWVYEIVNKILSFLSEKIFLLFFADDFG